MTSASASRVTRSSRSLRLTVVMFLGVLSVVTVLRAQERPPAAEAQTGTAGAAREAAPPASPAAQPEADPPATAADPAASRNASPTRFEPTEKVRADFDVSFPIDI